MNLTPLAPMTNTRRAQSGPKGHDGVVEIGLLLPTNRAAALMKLAEERRESVGQVLRKLIDRELTAPA